MYKCYNTVTGLWYIKGQGFTGLCSQGSILNPSEKITVCASYFNVAWIKL